MDEVQGNKENVPPLPAWPRDKIQEKFDWINLKFFSDQLGFKRF